MASQVEEALAEVEAALASLAPQREGLKDFQRLNLHPDTLDIINQRVAEVDRRYDLLQTVKSTLEALLADGFPTVPVKEIPASAYEDLRDNNNTIDAAFALFSEATATALGLSAGSPTPKG